MQMVGKLKCHSLKTLRSESYTFFMNGDVGLPQEHSARFDGSGGTAPCDPSVAAAS